MDFLSEWASKFLDGEVALRNSEEFMNASPEEQEYMLADFSASCDIEFNERCKSICLQENLRDEERKRQDEYVTALVCSRKLFRLDTVQEMQATLAAKVAELKRIADSLLNDELSDCCETIRVLVEGMIKCQC